MAAATASATATITATLQQWSIPKCRPIGGLVCVLDAPLRRTALYGSNLPSIVGCPHRTRQTSRLNGAARRECIRRRRQAGHCAGSAAHLCGCCCGGGAAAGANTATATACAAVVRATAAGALQLAATCSQHRQRATTQAQAQTQAC